MGVSEVILIASMTTLPVQDHWTPDETCLPVFDLTARDIAPVPSPCFSNTGDGSRATPAIEDAPVQDHRELPLPTIEWAEVERELERQGFNPGEVVAKAAASLEAWSTLSEKERKSLFEFPALDHE